MEYRYGKNMNYDDFASGRVFYHVKGITNFPARLAQEIFGRCLEYTKKKENLCIYDCCCGGAYMLTVLGFMNAGVISRITGSDINPDAVGVARRNLELLQVGGMDNRIKEIRKLAATYGKQSHEEAEQSCLRLRRLIENYEISTDTFIANALEGLSLDRVPDIIITDVPYGDLVTWEGSESGSVNRLLDNLYNMCGSDTVIGICMDKSQKNTHGQFRRLERQQLGKRRFEILKKVG